MLDKQQRHKLPRGWFAVACVKQVTDQKPLGLHFLDHHFVAWRDKNKRAIVIDGITHQGSALEHGSLEGDNLRCAVHGYLYDKQGNCIKAPFEQSIPPEAKRTIWQSQEVDGMLYIWHDPEHGEPLYTIPHSPEYDLPEWVRWDMQYCTIPTYPREVVDNIADRAHFPVVHKSETKGWETIFQGHKAYQLQKESYVAVEAVYHGPSYLLTHLASPSFKSYMLVCHTPITDNVLGLWVGLMCHKGPKPLSERKKMIIDGIIDMYIEGFFEDVTIWKHKVSPFDNPILCQGDGAIAEARAWYDQFYQPHQRQANVS